MSDRSGGSFRARLTRLGRDSWLALGVITLVVVIAMALGAVSGIVVPLVIAVIIGTVLEPFVEWLEKRRINPLLATVIGLFLSVFVLAGMGYIVVGGFIQQLPEISRQLVVGWNSFLRWVYSLDVDAVLLDRAWIRIQEYAPQAAQGVLGAAGSTFSGAVSFGIGTFFAIFLLFFVIRDGRRFPAWLARLTHQDPVVVGDVVGVAKGSLRAYFRGTAITAIVTGPIFMVPLLLLGVPLAGPIFILYFFLSFLPYVGAWITGAFAVLIAFGSGGAQAALIIAITFVISNGTIQSVVSSWALGSSLKLHPVVVLLATLIGGTIAGLIGMVLGAPLVAAVSRAIEVIQAYNSRDAEAIVETGVVERE